MVLSQRSWRTSQILELIFSKHIKSSFVSDNKLSSRRLCLVLVIPWSVCVAIHQEAELRYLHTHTAPVTQMMHTLRPPTSLRLKELWLLHFKMQIPKREQHYLSLLWNQYRSRFSLSSLPSSRRYSLLLRCLVKRIQKKI